MSDVLFVANSLTSYKSTVRFNHFTIDWITGLELTRPILLIIFIFLNHTINIYPSFEHQMHIDWSVYSCNP